MIGNFYKISLGISEKGRKGKLTSQKIFESKKHISAKN